MTSVPSTIGIVASGEDVLNDAVFWVDAGRSSVVSGALSNLGTGGSALNAVFGNSTGVDSFDPALLAHTGTNYLHLPGVASNDVSAPSITNYDITGDIEIEVGIAFATLTPASTTLMLTREGVDPNRAWSFYLSSGGLLGLRWFPTGSAASQQIVVSTATLASVGITAGQRVHVKVTLDVDNGAGGYQVRFWYSTNNGSSFSELGASPPPGVGTTSLPTVSRVLQINSSLSATQLNANLYRAIVRNGIGGTTVFDADFTTGITSGGQGTFTESSANAATVTINRSTSGRKAVAVTRPILLFGTDDYLEVADNDLLDFAAGDSFTVVAVVRQWATPTSFGRIIDKKNGGGVGVGWDLTSNGTAVQPAFFIGDATNGANRTGAVSSAGTLQIVSGIVNRSAQTAQLYTNNTPSATTSTTAVGSLANSLPMRIGIAANTLGSASDMELVAAAVWRRALNANEIATIVARYT